MRHSMRFVPLAPITAIAISIGMAVAPVTVASDWPQFRGPTGQGTTDVKLPLTWDTEKNVKWKASIKANGWSSPSIVDGKVYLTGAEPAGASLVLSAFCHDAATGKELWKTPLFTLNKPPRIHRKNSHASPTPIVEGQGKDGRVFVHFGPSGSACLDLSGNVIWKNNSFPYPAVHGSGGTPAMVGPANKRLLVFSCDAAKQPFVLALDAKTGKQAWRVRRDTQARKNFSFSTPLLIEVDGKQQLVLPGSDAVFAYEPTTGEAIWKVDYPGGYSVVPRPVFGGGLVYVSSGFDQARLFAIRPTGKGNVTGTHVAWKETRSVSKTPSFILHEGMLFLVSDNGIASCLDAKTGKEHWRERLKGGFSASPILADGKLYFLNETGTTYVVAAAKQFKVLATNDLGGRTLASPAVADGALFIRTDRHLYRIESP